MRITNSMIMNNAGGNINGTKVLVDKRNTQMTTQKKIQRPSEDPVIAVRSLRLQTTLNKVNQYYERNIPDAESWMDVTETALNNVKDIVTTMRTLANRGATETLTQDDRSTILSQMKALQDQVYNEGNADYAGRTVFTGYRTDKSLTFLDDDINTSYNIYEPGSADAITRNRYYTNTMTVPTNADEIADTSDIPEMTIQKTEYNVLRLGYDNITDINGFTYIKDEVEYTTRDFTDAKPGSGIQGTTGVAGDVSFRISTSDIANDATVEEIFEDDEESDGLSALDKAMKRLAEILSGKNLPALSDEEKNKINDSENSGRIEMRGYVLYTEDDKVGIRYPSPNGYDTGKLLIFDNEDDWATYCKNVAGDKTAPKTVGDDTIVMIKETGELIFGDKLASSFLTDNVDFRTDYYKQGFDGSELRPEYYFDCVQLTDEEGAGVGPQGKIYDPNSTMTYNDVYMNTIPDYRLVYDPATGDYKKVTNTTDTGTYDKNYDLGMVFDKQTDDGELIRYDINYTVAQNQELTVNLEAGECIDHNIYQDMGDMINAVEWAIAAHDKVDRIKAMMKQDQYADETSQTQLNKWLEVAQKEADYYDDNLTKMYSEQLGTCDSYLEDINLSITQMGCKGDQLSMTKTRMNNQQETVQELQSTNDDMDLSNIILKYTAAYTAYQSSLTAAGRLGQQTLLNYI